MELMNLLKTELFITYEEPEINTRLYRIILNAIDAMNHKIGAKIDYTVPSLEQALFINYCVYVYNGIENEFDNNYSHEIMQARIRHEVEDFNE